MALVKINTYGTATPADGDKLLGTDVSDTGTDANGATKNFTVASLLAHVEANATAFASTEQGGKADTAVQPGALGTAAAQDVEYFATAAQGGLADTAVQPNDLGTAAAEDVEAFATAEQGGKADTALQPEDIATGSITARADDLDLSGGSDGHVLTVQADGSAAFEALPASLASLAEDEAPELGGNLDLSGHTVGDATAADLTKLHEVTASAAELNHVNGVTDAIQTQLDDKAPKANPEFTGTVTLPVLTGVLRTDGGVVSAADNVTDLVSAASDTAAGVVELATSAEAIAGSDSERAVTPAGLAAAMAPAYVTLTGSRDTAPTDSGKDIESTASSGITLTVQVDTVPRGLILTQVGTGQVTIAAGSSVTILRESGFEAKTAGQYAVVALLPTSTANTYRLTGALELSE